jgi:hypothetical protein
MADVVFMTKSYPFDDSANKTSYLRLLVRKKIQVAKKEI